MTFTLIPGKAFPHEEFSIRILGSLMYGRVLEMTQKPTGETTVLSLLRRDPTPELREFAAHVDFESLLEDLT